MEAKVGGRSQPWVERLIEDASDERTGFECIAFFPVSGGNAGGVTPDPIPNSEVKPSRADGTARETVWESRSLPEFFLLVSENRIAG